MSRLGRNSGATGIIEQRGALRVSTPVSPPPGSVIGDYYNGTLSCRAGVGIFHQRAACSTQAATPSSRRVGKVENNFSNGFAVLTLENDAQAVVNSEIRLANRNGAPEAYVNLNGGALTARYFQKGRQQRCRQCVGRRDRLQRRCITNGRPEANAVSALVRRKQ